jgi:hypothetical protein
MSMESAQSLRYTTNSAGNWRLIKDRSTDVARPAPEYQ